MSQKAILVTVEENLIPEVFYSIPDYDDAVQICIDNGWDGTEDTIYDSYTVEYVWIEIGEGESGMDEFIDEETLLHIWGHYNRYEIIKETYGLDVEVIECDRIEVDFDDLTEEEDY